MTTVVTVVLIAAMASLAWGILAPLIRVRRRHRRPIAEITMSTRPIYWSFSVWTVALGILLSVAPPTWFGPSWSYFPQLPHNGLWMGVCLTILGSLEILALWRDASIRILSTLLFLAGFTYWTAGIILGAEGLLGHQGLIESPFMLYVGAHAFAHSAALTAHGRHR